MDEIHPQNCHLLVSRESNNQKAKLLHNSSLTLITFAFIFYQLIISFVPRFGPKILSKPPTFGIKIIRKGIFVKNWFLTKYKQITIFS